MNKSTTKYEADSDIWLAQYYIILLFLIVVILVFMQVDIALKHFWCF